MRLLVIRDAEKKAARIHVWNPIEVLTAVSTILSTIPLDEFLSVFEEWTCRLRECIDKAGEYR
jgi:hypothetical protein